MDKGKTKNIGLDHSEDSKDKPFTIRGYVAEMKKKNPELCSPFTPTISKKKRSPELCSPFAPISKKIKSEELCSPFDPVPKKEPNPVDEKQPTPTEKPAASGNEIA
ncbi:PREDICTED: uncharacterized protein LOC109167907 [Ipomoea nil]|uniref:uncharacterized protein LOC109167907 n=1 Tax=Ipomoea nil TaxID=35883 RepID=UPI000900DB93|nr:PREDICTED: uncharacterized protein LOC109167907 [Ipomoea nil]